MHILSRVFAVLFFVFPVLSSAEIGAQDCMIVVMPDTQATAAKYHDAFRAQTEWISKNAERLNIGAVLHAGDIVHCGRCDDQWERASSFMGTLDGRVPYALALGNHDYTSKDWRDASLFNKYFPVQRFQALSTFGGTFENGLMDNAYHLFDACGMQWLALALEYGPRNEVLDWANLVVASHPDRKVVVTTHAHLYRDGTLQEKAKGHMYSPLNIEFAGNGSTTVNEGVDVWHKFLRHHPNVMFVFNGHVLGENKSLGASARKQGLGNAGNRVFQMLANYQTSHRGGNGLLRLLAISASRNVVEVQTYSPRTDAYRTKGDNEFSFELIPTELFADTFSDDTFPRWTTIDQETNDSLTWRVIGRELTLGRSMRRLRKGYKAHAEQETHVYVDTDVSAGWRDYMVSVEIRRRSGIDCMTVDVNRDRVIDQEDILAVYAEVRNHFLRKPLTFRRHRPGFRLLRKWYDLRTKIHALRRCAGTTLDDAAGLLFRYQHPETHYRLELEWYSHQARLIRSISGQEEVLKTSAVDIHEYEANRLFVQVVGNRMDFVINDTELFEPFADEIEVVVGRKFYFGFPVDVIALVDQSIPSGSVGLYSRGDGLWSFDDVVVENR